MLWIFISNQSKKSLCINEIDVEINDMEIEFNCERVEINLFFFCDIIILVICLLELQPHVFIFIYADYYKCQALDMQILVQ